MGILIVRRPLLRVAKKSVNGTLFSQSLTLNSNGWTGYTGVIRIPASAMALPSGSITRIRFRLQAGSTEGFTVTNMYTEHRAGSGDPYDFATTPVQVLFAGSASKVIAAGTQEWSDWVTFAYDKTNDLLASFYCNGGSSSDMLSYATSTGATKYEKIANDAATVNKTGYSTASGFTSLINAIESDGF